MVDLDHAPKLLNTKVILEFMTLNGMNEYRPLHLILLLMCIMALFLIFILADIVKSQRINLVLCFVAGVLTAVLTHVFFDYVFSCYFLPTRFSCFTVDPGTGAKIKELFTFHY